jgi:hypothetical protein
MLNGRPRSPRSHHERGQSIGHCNLPPSVGGSHEPRESQRRAARTRRSCGSLPTRRRMQLPRELPPSPVRPCPGCFLPFRPARASVHGPRGARSGTISCGWLASRDEGVTPEQVVAELRAADDVGELASSRAIDNVADHDRWPTGCARPARSASAVQRPTPEASAPAASLWSDVTTGASPSRREAESQGGGPSGQALFVTGCRSG